MSFVIMMLFCLCLLFLMFLILYLRNSSLCFFKSKSNGLTSDNPIGIHIINIYLQYWMVEARSGL